MQYTIKTYNTDKRVWELAATLCDTDRHTAKFIELIIRERAKTDTILIVMKSNCEYVCTETTPYKGE